jgi:hypothetical protein
LELKKDKKIRESVSLSLFLFYSSSKKLSSISLTVAADPMKSSKYDSSSLKGSNSRSISVV